MIIKFIKLTLLFVCFIQLFSSSVRAEVRPYLITNGFYEPTPSRVNYAYFIKTMGMEYKSGTVVLSSNPDGTGYISVGDFLDLNMGYPQQGYLELKSTTNCVSFQDYFPPQNITSFFKGYLNEGMHSITIRLKHLCLRPKNIGPIYLVHIIPDVTPSPTPTPTPSPTPKPFLDLPWDYQSKGMSFVDAALSMSSYFDHEYPLLSSGLQEPKNALGSLVSYEENKQTIEKSYSKHDGYDYSGKAHVKLGDPVLAAASGNARYVSSCGDCGNMIVIDHGNGYQTRYMHMQLNGLLSTDSAKIIPVTAGQQIGKVGFSGNVSPAGETGAHIHFGVFQDVNKDGNFDDNIPDGVTDPFGWKSKDPDPWEQYTFDYYGTQKKGNKSYYLWNHEVDDRNGELLPEGGIFSVHNAVFNFPSGATSAKLFLSINNSPVVEPSADLVSIGAGYTVKAFDSAGTIVSNFLNAFSILIDFATYDLSNLKPGTLSIYSSQDGTTWNKEETTIDMANKKAITSVNHLTEFALMGERLDTEPPVTTVHFQGDQGTENNFRSDVNVSFEAVDNENGLGIDYSAVSYEGPEGKKEWDKFEGVLSFKMEGNYKIEYYSVDKDGNTEPVKNILFSIDKTPPEAEILYDLNSYDSVVVGHDGTEPAQVEKIDLGKQKEKIIVSDNAGNTLTIFDKDREKGRKAVMNIYSLQYNNGNVVDVSENKIFFNAQIDKDNSLKSFNQLYQVKGEKKIELDYSLKTNKTKVILKVKGQDKVKEEVDGVVFLKLLTNKGLINYQY